MNPEHITADQAIEAIERCATEVTETWTNGDVVLRRVVHCLSGFIGADWGVDAAIAAVRNAYVHEGVPQIAWVDHFTGRCLTFIERESDDGGRQRFFDGVTPEEAP